MIIVAWAVLGALLGLFGAWLVSAPARRRSRENTLHLNECARHTHLAAQALREQNIEKYEAHMVLAIKAFDRISDYQDKDGGS